MCRRFVDESAPRSGRNNAAHGVSSLTHLHSPARAGEQCLRRGEGSLTHGCALGYYLSPLTGLLGGRDLWHWRSAGAGQCNQEKGEELEN